MSNKSARIVFMGSPEFAVPSLKALAAQHHICAVYTQPARRKGRGMKSTPTPVAEAALALNLPCFSPEKLRGDAEYKQLETFQADFFIVVAYGQILSRRVLDIPAKGCINAHASLLPRWRGAAPIQRAIEAGDAISGISAMMMAEGLDTGPVINQHTVEITETMTAGMLHDRLADIAPLSLGEAVSSLMQGSPELVVQDEEKACYAAKITPAEAWLDLNLEGAKIGRKIRAFNPFPGAFIHSISGRLKVLEADIIPEFDRAAPGIFHGVDDKGRMLIGCGKGAIAASRIQLAGKKPMGVSDFLNGQSWVSGQHILADL